MAIGVPEVLILALLGVPLVAAVFLWLGLSRRARRMGFGSTVEYLRSAPRSDAEKRDAADLAVKGLLWCTLGLLFSPLVLIGVVPAFYGVRKLTYASLGLGLVEDAE
jgi:hypothetical protein